MADEADPIEAMAETEAPEEEPAEAGKRKQADDEEEEEDAEKVKGRPLTEQPDESKSEPFAVVRRGAPVSDRTEIAQGGDWSLRHGSNCRCRLHWHQDRPRERPGPRQHSMLSAETGGSTRKARPAAVQRRNTAAIGTSDSATPRRPPHHPTD